MDPLPPLMTTAVTRAETVNTLAGGLCDPAPIFPRAPHPASSGRTASSARTAAPVNRERARAPGPAAGRA